MRLAQHGRTAFPMAVTGLNFGQHASTTTAALQHLRAGRKLISHLGRNPVLLLLATTALAPQPQHQSDYDRMQ